MPRGEKVDFYIMQDLSRTTDAEAERREKVLDEIRSFFRDGVDQVGCGFFGNKVEPTEISLGSTWEDGCEVQKRSAYRLAATAPEFTEYTNIVNVFDTLGRSIESERDRDDNDGRHMDLIIIVTDGVHDVGDHNGTGPIRDVEVLEELESAVQRLAAICAMHTVDTRLFLLLSNQNHGNLGLVRDQWRRNSLLALGLEVVEVKRGDDLREVVQNRVIYPSFSQPSFEFVPHDISPEARGLVLDGRDFGLKYEIVARSVVGSISRRAIEIGDAVLVSESGSSCDLRVAPYEGIPVKHFSISAPLDRSREGKFRQDIYFMFPPGGPQSLDPLTGYRLFLEPSEKSPAYTQTHLSIAVPEIDRRLESWSCARAVVMWALVIPSVILALWLAIVIVGDCELDKVRRVFDYVGMLIAYLGSTIVFSSILRYILIDRNLEVWRLAAIGGLLLLGLALISKRLVPLEERDTRLTFIYGELHLVGYVSVQIARALGLLA